MRLAVSNIAWPAEQEVAVADRLATLGVAGVEVAPTKVWPHPLEAGAADVRAYRDFWEQRGLPIVALQALLFEKPDLRIFASAAQRMETLAYLTGIIRLAGQLGVRVLVFGSPKNRSRGDRSLAEAHAVAIPFFRELGRVARDHGTVFCIEPNPTAYGCDYVTCATEGLALVRAVDELGFGLHLDAAAMTLSGDPPAEVFAEAGAHWHHFHVSEPGLAPVGGGMDHRPLAAALRQSGYAQWLSIEMRVPSEGFDISRLESAVTLVRSVYGQEARRASCPEL